MRSKPCHGAQSAVRVVLAWMALIVAGIATGGGSPIESRLDLLSSLGGSVSWAGETGFSGGAGSIHKDRGGAYRQLSKERMKRAGDLPYHNEETLICSDCHVMHASMQHNHAGGSDWEGGVPSYPATFTPSPKLLKAADPLDLCLACHDGQTGIPDVMGADANGLAARSAGHFGMIEELNPRGHNLGRGLDSGLCTRCHWSTPEDEKVTCIDCHRHHGNGVARNLCWASDPEGTPPLGLLIDPAASGMDRYERDNVAYGTLNTVVLREMTNMCLDCHHVFTGDSYNDPDGDGIHSRHPSYDSERGDPNSIDQGQVRGSTNPVHWEGGTGSGFNGADRTKFVVSGASDYATAAVVDASTNGVFCISCHKAHGSDNAFSMQWDLAGAVERPGCDQCHLIQPAP